MKVHVGRKTFLAIALIGASVLMAPSVVAADEVSASSSPAELRAYVRRLDELIKQDPQAKYFGSKGQALELLGDNEGAVKAFTKNIESAPRDRVAIFRRAENLRKLSRFQDALKDYNQLVDSGERETFIFCGRSICKSNLGDYKGGFEDAASTISLNKDCKDGWFAKGCAEYHSRTGDFGIASFSKSIKLSPTCKECWAMRSQAYEAKGDITKSKADLKRARILGF